MKLKGEGQRTTNKPLGHCGGCGQLINAAPSNKENDFIATINDIGLSRAGESTEREHAVTQFTEFRQVIPTEAK